LYPVQVIFLVIKLVKCLLGSGQCFSDLFKCFQDWFSLF
jgi:hypothetical protein